MDGSLFARWGRFCYRQRVLVLAASVVVLLLSAWQLIRGGTLNAVVTANVEAVRAAHLIERELPVPGKTSFQLVYRSDRDLATSDAFRDRVRASLTALSKDPHVAGVIDPWSLPPAFAPTQLSTDGHAAVVDVWVRDDIQVAIAYFGALRREVAPVDGMTITATGPLAEQHDFDEVLEHDLIRAELVSVPIALVVLLAVFGSAVAALLPVVIGLFAVAAGIAVIFLASRHTPITPYAMNVVSLIGLGVAIDYSLFIVSRFREELETGASIEQCVERSIATAGRAVAFSGLAVTIGLGGLLFYRGMHLDVIGVAASIVVFFSVLCALGTLPALLGVLGAGVERGKFPFLRLSSDSTLWRKIGGWVMDRPLLVLLPILTILLLAGVPFKDITTANSDVTVLPTDVEARRGYQELEANFPYRDPNPLVIVAQFPDSPRTFERMLAIGKYELSLLDIPGVARVDGPIPMEILKDRIRALRLLAARPKEPPPEMKLLLERTTGPTIAIIAVKSKEGPTAESTRKLLAELRGHRELADGTVMVTGRTAADVDLFNYVKSRTPRTVAFVVGATVLILLIALRSFLLPIKAVLMNGLSISASFGALVWIFQQGHLSSVLAFSPRPIEPVLPVLLFCLVFGLSMDYEVLLLSRMQEEWDESGDNRKAVMEGLARTAQLITSAAIIMVVVFAAFGAARVVLIKAVGFGMALAVALDATIVRTLVVPATMRLMGDWNWWGPGRKKR